MKENPNYYAIIPANVRYDKELPDKAKLLYGEIIALSDKEGYCWATNNYFANLYGVSKMTISRLIKQLANKKYIEVEIKYKKDSKEIEGRYIKICIYPYIQKCIYPIYKNVKDNNTSINNTSINNNIYIVEIVEYLNNKLGTKYKSTTPKTKSMISARLKEGFTVDDFKTVIDNKYNDWFNDSNMNKYLRPETLFGTKFENYLNQKTKKRDSEEEILKYLEEMNK